MFIVFFSLEFQENHLVYVIPNNIFFLWYIVVFLWSFEHDFVRFAFVVNSSISLEITKLLDNG